MTAPRANQNADTSNLSANAQKILSLIHGGATDRAAIAKKMRASVQSVNGSITALVRAGHVTRNEDGSLATEGGAQSNAANDNGDNPRATGPGSRGHRPGSKMSKARAIFLKAQEGEKDRQWTLGQFTKKLGLTPKGASTYYQSLKREVEAQGADA